MKSFLKRLKPIHYTIILVVLILVFDQILKIHIKTNFKVKEDLPIIGEWFKLYFIENPGMAFGWMIGGKAGKITLTLFRMVASVLIILYIRNLVKKQAPAGLIISLGLILAGAMGNIIDSLFYGMLFTESTMVQVAEFSPGNGYAPFLQGDVVDMLKFKLFDGTYPSWFPFKLGGKPFEFFGPIFNIADSAITTGVAIILVFQRRYFRKVEEINKKLAEETAEEQPVAAE